jgi:hypothetical protein
LIDEKLTPLTPCRINRAFRLPRLVTPPYPTYPKKNDYNLLQISTTLAIAMVSDYNIYLQQPTPNYNSESKIQGDCYTWFHNTYPSLRGLLCYNLNNSKNKIDGNLNKAMGLQKGRSDMVLYYHSRAYMLEFKTPHGNQSHEQLEWMGKVEREGFEYHIIRSLSEFQFLIKSIVK